MTGLAILAAIAVIAILAIWLLDRRKDHASPARIAPARPRPRSTPATRIRAARARPSAPPSEPRGQFRPATGRRPIVAAAASGPEPRARRGITGRRVTDPDALCVVCGRPRARCTGH